MGTADSSHLGRVCKPPNALAKSYVDCTDVPWLEAGVAHAIRQPRPRHWLILGRASGLPPDSRAKSIASSLGLSGHQPASRIAGKRIVSRKSRSPRPWRRSRRANPAWTLIASILRALHGPRIILYPSNLKALAAQSRQTSIAQSPSTRE